MPRSRNQHRRKLAMREFDHYYQNFQGTVNHNFSDSNYFENVSRQNYSNSYCYSNIHNDTSQYYNNLNVSNSSLNNYKDQSFQRDNSVQNNVGYVASTRKPKYPKNNVQTNKQSFFNQNSQKHTPQNYKNKIQKTVQNYKKFVQSEQNNTPQSSQNCDQNVQGNTPQSFKNDLNKQSSKNEDFDVQENIAQNPFNSSGKLWYSNEIKHHVPKLYNKPNGNNVDRYYEKTDIYIQKGYIIKGTLYQDPSLFYGDCDSDDNTPKNHDPPCSNGEINWTNIFRQKHDGEANVTKASDATLSKRRVPRKNQNHVEKTLNDMLAKPVEMSKGKSLLEKMGWTGGGLGRDGVGILEPITPEAAYAVKTIGLGHPTERLNVPTKVKKTKTSAPLPKYSVKKHNLKNKFYINVLLYILEFVKNDTKKKLSFEPRLKDSERAKIHQVVEKIRESDNLEDFENYEDFNETHLELVKDIWVYNIYELWTESDGPNRHNRVLSLFKEAPVHIYLVSPEDLTESEEQTVNNEQIDIDDESDSDNSENDSDNEDDKPKCKKKTTTKQSVDETNHIVVKNEPNIKNETIVVKSEPNIKPNEQVVVQSEPNIKRNEQVVHSEPNIKRNEQVVVQSEPNIKPNEQVVVQSEPNIKRNEQVVVQSEPNIKQNEQVVVQSEPNIKQNEQIGTESDLNSVKNDQVEIEKDSSQEAMETNENTIKSDEESILSKIIKYFKEFCEDDRFEEFRFLGPFSDEEVSNINVFLNICLELDQSEYEEKIQIVEEFEKRPLSVMEDNNGRAFIKKGHDIPHDIPSEDEEDINSDYIVCVD